MGGFLMKTPQVKAADAAMAQGRAFVCALFLAGQQSAKTDFNNNKRMRANAPACKAVESRTRQWQVEPRPLWLRRLWRSWPFVAALAHQMRSPVFLWRLSTTSPYGGCV